MVGAPQYLTFTRPDLAFSIHQLCQFMQHPTTSHFEAAKRVLRYVKGTLHQRIHFSSGLLTLSTFTNVDWARDPSNRRSATMFSYFLGPAQFHGHSRNNPQFLAPPQKLSIEHWHHSC